jgi:hypothetical protein
LLASAFLLIVATAGIVTFQSWPGADGLLGGVGHVSLPASESSVPSAPVPAAPSAVTPLGGPGPAARSARRIGHASARSGPRGTGTQVIPPSGADVGQAPGVAPSPPSESPVPHPADVVSRTVSAAGNTVEATTDTVGDQLGGSSGPGVGGLVGNAGRTVNQSLQTLAGDG